MSFRFRHDNFCGKCEDNGLIDTVEQAELDNIVRCKKCAKTKFRSGFIDKKDTFNES